MVLRRLMMAGLLLGINIGAADAFDLPIARSGASAEELLAGDAGAWAGAIESAIALNRTPPLFEGDPVDDGVRPDLRVMIARSAGALFVRMRWTDPTDSTPREAEAVADVGEAGIYKKHSTDIDRFADAACVMVPRTGGAQAAFPSLMMGEAGRPVQLYYWNSVRAFERLEAAGRGTTSRTSEVFPGHARRTDEGWDVVLALPDQPESTPISFAVWDGDQAQRDGLKFYSVWYALAP